MCVYVCTCVCTLVFPLSSGLPTTNIPPSLFPSFSLPLPHCTSFPLYPLWTMKGKHNLSSRSQPSTPQKTVTSTYIAVKYALIYCSDSIFVRSVKFNLQRLKRLELSRSRGVSFLLHRYFSITPISTFVCSAAGAFC